MKKTSRRILIVVLSVFAALAAGFFALGALMNGPLTKAQAGDLVRKALGKSTKGRADRRGASILVHSERLGIDILARSYSGDAPAEAFHIASVGKLFTTVLVARLVEAGRLAFEDTIAPLLAPGRLDGLFVVDGRDFQADVTVAQLLSHSSGAADYFADPVRGGKPLFDLIHEEPQRRWTPDSILDFCRDGQKAIGKPGERFHYSDTGFILLGLAIEKLYGSPFEKVLADEILKPLGMERTWMPFRSLPAKGGTEIRAAWLQGAEVSAFPSITADWAGGGIASTEADLLKFDSALNSGTIVSLETLGKLKRFDALFSRGIHYGNGIMELRFGEFFPLLASYPRMTGHMGILATQLFYDTAHDLHIVVTLGSDAAMEDSVKLLIEALGIALRIRPEGV